jgi:hypothetical protein
MLLQTAPIEYDGHPLHFAEEVHGKERRTIAAQPTQTPNIFVPRKAASKPKAGIGAARRSPVVSQVPTNPTPSSSTQNGQSGRSQDDFRKML